MASIESLPESSYLLIASYLHPPEVYLFNKAIPAQANLLACASPSNVTIGQLCLHASHRISLTQILRHTSPLFSLEKAKALSNSIQLINSRPQKSLLLSGSTLVQAATGLIFPNPKDLDFYTNMRALKDARNMLKEMGFLCHNIRKSYYEDNDLLIHHIESYVIDTNTDSGEKRPSLSAYEIERGWKINRHLLPLPDYHRGKAISQLGRCRFSRSFPLTQSADEHITKIVDLVVLNGGFSPRDALTRFDLGICKGYFDGKNFGNIQSEKTYFFVSDWDLNWQVLVNSYITAFLAECDLPEDGDRLSLLSISKNNINEQLQLMKSFTVAAAKDNRWQFPCSRHGFSNCDCRVDILNNDYLFKLHTRIVEQLRRALKYIRRGIDIPSLNDELITIFLGESTLLSLVNRRKHYKHDEPGTVINSNMKRTRSQMTSPTQRQNTFAESTLR